MQKLRKITLTIAVLSIASGYGKLAEAYCIGPLGYFGTSSIIASNPSAKQYDAYTTTCPVGTAYLRARVGKSSGSSPDLPTTPITLTVTRSGSVSASDANGINYATQCDGSGPTGSPNEGIGSGGTSSWITRNGGAGTYTIMVSKSSAKPMGYAVEFDCFNAAGVPRAPTCFQGGVPGEVCRTANN